MSDVLHEPYREVAAAILIGTCNRFLFQQRDDIPGLLYAGMIGLFGGHREGDESFLACLQREIEEETGQVLAADRCQPIVELSARYPMGGGVSGAFFVVRDVPLADVVVTEGSGLIVERGDLPAILPKMTPSACYVTRLFMEMKPAV